jgi:large subunit ribosomal protein L29
MKNTFKEITQQEAVAKLDELKKKYLNLRFDSVLGHLENPLEKRTVRRQIARLKTILHEYESGKRK